MNIKICIVIANYYPNISKNLLFGASHLLKKKKNNFKIIKTTGIFEIPIIISRNIKKYDAFLALGCVIKGKTPHFTFISQSATDAIMKLAVDYKKPIGNGIITCLNMKQAVERSDPKKKNKGGEAARAIISVLGN
jgi:6,7-dimethyl-8-ribityllumazine synthase